MRLRSTVLPGLVALLTLAGCGSSGTRTVVVTRAATPLGGTTPVGGTATSPMSTTTQTITSKSNSLVVGPTPTTTHQITVTLPHLPVPGTKTGTVNTVSILARSSKKVHLTNFRSPTGNIGCVILDGAARCDIAQRSWKPPPRAASCSHGVDFGQGLVVSGSGKGGFVCAGDTALDPTATPLRYGYVSIEGHFACLSAFSGMTCTDVPDGHGFFISRQRYRVF